MTIRGATPDPHRVADGGVADTGLGPETHADSIPAALSTGPFTVQWLSDGWFVGLPGAAQRVEDPTGLDSWLAANGQMDRTALEFGGDRELEQRFWSEMDTGGATAQ
jgi:hypothetical protein